MTRLESRYILTHIYVAIFMLFISCSGDDDKENLIGTWKLQTWTVSCEMESDKVFTGDTNGCILVETQIDSGSTIVTITEERCMQIILADDGSGFLVSGTSASLDSTPVTYTLFENKTLELCRSSNVCIEYNYEGDSITLVAPTTTIELDECTGVFMYRK